MPRLDKNQESIRDAVREFARKEIVPLVGRADWDGSFPDSVFQSCNQLGLLGISAPREFGGLDSDFTTVIAITEELSKVSPSLAAQIALHNVVYHPLTQSTNQELVRSIVPLMVQGELGSISFDKSKLRCRLATKDLILNGTCDRVIGATYARIFLIRTDIEGTDDELLAFVSRSNLKNANKFHVKEPVHQVGMRPLGAATIAFDDLKLPLNSIVLDAKKAKVEFAMLQAMGRLVVAAQALGIADATVESLVKYASRTEGVKRSSPVREMIVSALVNLESARAHCYSVATDLDSSSFQNDSAISRLSASACAVNIGVQAIRICGPGIANAYPIDRFVKDAITTKDLIESEESLKNLTAVAALG